MGYRESARVIPCRACGFIKVVVACSLSACELLRVRVLGRQGSWWGGVPLLLLWLLLLLLVLLHQLLGVLRSNLLGR